MMQFTLPLQSFQQKTTSFCSNTTMNQNQVPTPTTTTSFPIPKTLSSSSSSFGDSNCMEQLLVHCANAIETNDVTLAQQILWVLNNIAIPDGNSNQRLASSFLHALAARAARIGSCKMLLEAMMGESRSRQIAIDTHKFSVIELANFVDLTPWHRFGFTAANAAIIEASEGFSVIHIVDISLMHCMQIPMLIDAIATRHEVPPLIKLTVAGDNFSHIPPILDLSYDELGAKLVNFASSRNVIMEFKVVHSSYTDGFASLIEHLKVQQHLVYASEALVINCHMMLHYIPDETLIHEMNSNSYIYDYGYGYGYDFDYSTLSLRTLFLKAVRSLDPTIVILVDEDADLTSNNLVCRLKSAFNYLWIPYDTVDTFLPRGSKQREWYEACICWKIENVIAHEGVQRIERVESKNKWEQRMKNAKFNGVMFSEDCISEVKTMLDEHSYGWGLKKEDQHIVLTWKGHNVVFASVWLPS